VDATVSYQGRPYDECREWGREVLRRLTGPDRPDVVITSSVYDTALDAGGHESAPAFAAGLASTWRALEDAGATVVAISNTPRPPDDILPVYECVAEHLDDPDVCSWPYEPSPASTTPRSVADEVGAHYADMDPWVCPGGSCVGVYRNVLTYRQGSHLTVTFVDVLAAPLEERLSALVG
jgi:hypothetical protein